MDFQLWGSSSLSLVMECAGMRESTSWNHANGSTPHRLQDAMKLRSTAAVVAAEEGPVAAAELYVAVGSFRGAVVDLHSPSCRNLVSGSHWFSA